MGADEGVVGAVAVEIPAQGTEPRLILGGLAGPQRVVHHVPDPVGRIGDHEHPAATLVPVVGPHQEVRQAVAGQIRAPFEGEPGHVLGPPEELHLRAGQLLSPLDQGAPVDPDLEIRLGGVGVDRHLAGVDRAIGGSVAVEIPAPRELVAPLEHSVRSVVGGVVRVPAVLARQRSGIHLVANPPSAHREIHRSVSGDVSHEVDVDAEIVAVVISGELRRGHPGQRAVGGRLTRRRRPRGTAPRRGRRRTCSASR